MLDTREAYLVYPRNVQCTIDDVRLNILNSEFGIQKSEFTIQHYTLSITSATASFAKAADQQLQQKCL